MISLHLHKRPLLSTLPTKTPDPTSPWPLLLSCKAAVQSASPQPVLPHGVVLVQVGLCCYSTSSSWRDEGCQEASVASLSALPLPSSALRTFPRVWSFLSLLRVHIFSATEQIKQYRILVTPMVYQWLTFESLASALWAQQSRQFFGFVFICSRHNWFDCKAAQC